MAIDLYWDDDEQTVILCEFKNGWTWDDLHAALTTIKRLSADRNRVFGAIIDVRKGLNIPGGSIFNREALANFQKMTSLGAGGKGPVVILGMNGMIKTIFDTVKKMDSKTVSDVYFADTMPDAQRVIYGLVNRLDKTSA
jgi:hypothetical protein